MPLFRYQLEGEDVEREVDVDNVGVMGSFVVTKKGPVTELIPDRFIAAAQIIEGLDDEDDGES